MQPFLLANDIERRYGEYIQTTFPFLDPKLADQLGHKIKHEHLLGTGPVVSLQRPFAIGETVRALGTHGELHPTVAKIFEGWELRAHQVQALRRLSERGGMRSTVIATGTGSGKTEAFLLPILDYCVRHPGPGVKALLVYPMNALANDQLERLRRYLNGTGITFARYTGDTPSTDGDTHPGLLATGQDYRDGGPIPTEECYSREAIRRRQPNILITGYRMLEYLLVRRDDQRIFRLDGGPAHLRYLVLDEAHTYTGALGSEVACLIRRLRGHIDRHGDSLACVAASATVGDDQAKEVLSFASQLFAVPFEPDALVQETYAPTIVSSGPITLIPTSEKDIAAHTERASEPVSDEIAQALYARLDDDPTIVWLRSELVHPRAFDSLVAAFAKEVASDDLAACSRHLIASLLQGTIARNTDGALLRPRLHVVHRGLAGAARCLRCDELLENGDDLCPKCESRALPIEICRQCGQDFLRAALKGSNAGEAPQLHTLDTFDICVEESSDLFDAGPTTLRFVTSIHKENPDDNDDEDEESASAVPPEFIPARVCTDSYCGHVALRVGEGPCTKCGNEQTRQLFLVAVGKLRACTACGYRYGVDREPITSLASSTAIGVSILTWLTLGHLPVDQRKLLIFADSRQDTAYQAGYLQDVTAEYSWRQLTYQVIARKPQDSPDFDGFWKELYKMGRSEFEIFSKENLQRQLNELHFFCVQEFTREATRRTSLENLGLIHPIYRELDRIVAHRAFERFRAACSLPRELCPLDDVELVDILGTILDFIRRAGAISDEFASKFWEASEELRGLDRFNRRPVAFRRLGTPSRTEKCATIKPLVGSKGRPTSIQRFFARIGISDPKSAVEAAIELLEKEDYLSEVSIGGTLVVQKVRNVLALNAGLLALERPPKLWRCINCATINLRNVRGRCYRATCEGDTLRPIDSADDANFYVHMYRNVKPIRLDVREHSGQISGEKREEYEKSFRAGKVNVLVASPTLELGVDIGALATVLLRGLPPSPASYAQRAGRAGRRERIALVASYAQNTPHDNYFFDHPDEMISGLISAPHFDLDNATIVRRHIRSLALEKLELQLPPYMKAFLDIAQKERPSPEDYMVAKLITRSPALDELGSKRETIVEAVRRAFHDEGGLACLSPEEIRRVIDEFEHDLRNVLEAWHSEVKQVAEEIARINTLASPSSDEKQRRAQLERTLIRLTAPPTHGGYESKRSEAYVLGYLASHGFLPSYALPGEPATLFSRDLDDAELQRDPLLALQEFAPGAVVYVDGKKVRSLGLNLVRAIPGTLEQFVGGIDSQYYRCRHCAYHAESGWIADCPSCGVSEGAEGERRLEARFYRGSADAQINSSEERRARTPFDTSVVLFGEPSSGTIYSYDTVHAEYRRRQRLLAINRGLRQPDGKGPGFEICLECGDARPPGVVGHEKLHLNRRKHKWHPFITNLTYEFESDVLTIASPRLDADASITLRHALLAAIRIEYQADEDELRGFELAANGRQQQTVVLFETVNGGAGYLRRAAEQLPRLAARAISIVEHGQPCVAACYRCLLTYSNQRDHGTIDKRLIDELLRSLVIETTPIPTFQKQEASDTSENELTNGKAESPIEILLNKAMQEHLSGYALQTDIRDPQTRKLVSRPDMLFAGQRVAVYADGKEAHSSPDQLAHDTRVRTRVKELGFKVLYFPGSRIHHDVGGCIAAIVKALEEST